MDRKEFEMTQEDYDKIIAASQSVPYLVAGGVEPISPQERANAAWRELGSRMGFEFMTVKPSQHGKLFFAAEPAAPSARSSQ